MRAKRSRRKASMPEGWCLRLPLCLALCVHATRVHVASGQFPARGGLPTSSYPTNFNMGQAPPQASLSSYDQEILSKGPPGIGAGAASDTPPMNPRVSPT